MLTTKDDTLEGCVLPFSAFTTIGFQDSDVQLRSGPTVCAVYYLSELCFCTFYAYIF